MISYSFLIEMEALGVLFEEIKWTLGVRRWASLTVYFSGNLENSGQGHRTRHPIWILV